MAESKIQSYLPREEWIQTAGTPTYVNIGSQAEFEKYLFDSPYRKQAIVFSNWFIPTGSDCLPEIYGSGIILPCVDSSVRKIIYMTTIHLYICSAKYNTGGTITYNWQIVTTTSI